MVQAQAASGGGATSAAASPFDALWHPETSPAISSSHDAVRAAVVAVAKDMEFIGRGGVLMPEMSELRKFIRNCVPHIVRGEYIDSYFINQEHGKIFWKLRGRGFKADDEMINEALSEVEPIYDGIVRSLTGQGNSSKEAEKAAATLAEPTVVARPMTSQDAAALTRFNVLTQRFGADAADVLAELRDAPQPGSPSARELVIVMTHPDAMPSVDRLAAHAGFEKRRNGQYALSARDMRELLHKLAAALNQNSAASPEQLRKSN